MPKTKGGKLNIGKAGRVTTVLRSAGAGRAQPPPPQPQPPPPQPSDLQKKHKKSDAIQAKLIAKRKEVQDRKQAEKDAAADAKKFVEKIQKEKKKK